MIGYGPGAGIGLILAASGLLLLLGVLWTLSSPEVRRLDAEINTEESR
ncbi:hypothetical protein LJK87_11355 [Paenibacillus sp. P25]|nr:hypothetical protein LJK87_11355 [Paenibacillus sp. P25]